MDKLLEALKEKMGVADKPHAGTHWGHPSAPRTLETQGGQLPPLPPPTLTFLFHTPCCPRLSLQLCLSYK